MIRRPPRSTLSSSSAASDVYKRQDTISGVLHAREAEVLDRHRVVHFMSAVLQRCWDKMQHAAGTVLLSRVSSLLGPHAAHYPEQLSQQQFNSLVVDTASASAQPSAVLGSLVKLSSEGTHSPGGPPTHASSTQWPAQLPPSMPAGGVEGALHRLFDQLDTDRNQSLDARELGDLTQFLRVMWKDSSAAPIGFDSTQIDRTQFVRVLTELLQRVFRALDVANSGVLGQPEMMQLERAFSADGHQSLVKQMQADAAYRVRLPEFGMFVVNSCFSKLGWGMFRSALQKLIELASISSQGWQGVQQHVSRIFDVMDKNRSGTIEVDELGDLGNVLQREWQDGSWYDLFREHGGSLHLSLIHISEPTRPY
eukprot:TRINITY_DN5085_c0_g1_i3.p1 TRINITY_DN5085_c0_g1~~TRINITY_DN5085_c0_g1_i3.p1  ORF type:complete len:366 (+),score=133.62 TRINITY_DN5085_c0_g1_i3:85-1182(+)